MKAAAKQEVHEEQLVNFGRRRRRRASAGAQRFPIKDCLVTLQAAAAASVVYVTETPTAAVELRKAEGGGYCRRRRSSRKLASYIGTPRAIGLVPAATPSRVSICECRSGGAVSLQQESRQSRALSLE